jgi:YD repeat-containing protein
MNDRYLLAGLLSLCFAVQSAQAQTLPTPPQSPVPVANFEYDAQGNPTKTVAAPGVPGLGLSTSHGYDALGRRTYSVDAKNGLTQFGYDGQSRVTLVKDPRNLNTQYQRSGLGDVVTQTSPDSGISTATYDAGGNLKTSTDARGFLSTYSYDALGRPTARTIIKSGSTTRQYTWVYDQAGGSFGYGIGRLTTASSPDVTTQLGYDAQGRTVRASQTVPQGVARTTSYTYNAAGHIATITYPSGRVVSYAYIDGLPSAVSVAAAAGATPQPLLTGIEMSPFGPAKRWNWAMAAGPLLHERAYDSSGRMVRYPLGSLVRDLSYDAADRIISYRHYASATEAPSPTFNQSFGYDGLGRLTSVQTNATNWAYTYDANGNRTSVATGSGARAYSVASNSNRLNSITNPSRQFTYDTAGNTLVNADSGLSDRYTATYSAEGRLTGMDQSNLQSVDYLYDAFGQRVRRGYWAQINNNDPPPGPTVVTGATRTSTSAAARARRAA